MAGEDEDLNPFEKHARQLTTALEGLAETYKFAPSDHRAEDFASAVQKHLDPDLAEEEAVQHVLDMLGASESGAESGRAAEASAGSTSAGEEVVDTVLDALLESVTRMISIPNHFWRQFTGNTLVHPSEKDFLYTSDIDTLREQLLSDEISERERNERLQHLRDAVESLVAHNMAMLAGYKKSVMAGSKELLQRVNPIDAVKEAEGSGGGMMGGLFGGGEKSELEKLDERWKELFHGEWGQMENELFRPTYIDAYVDRMAQTWDMDQAELVQEEGGQGA